MTSSVSDKGLTPLHVIASGALANSLEVVTLGHVLDRIKVEQEARPELKTAVAAIRAIKDKGGIGEFYKGFRWNTLSCGLKGSMRWSINHYSDSIAKKISPESLEKQHPKIFAAEVGMLTSTFETFLFHCPVERLKTVEMTQAGKLDLKQRIHKEGFKFFVQGWDKVLLQKNISWVSFLVSYQFFLDRAKENKFDDNLFQKFSIGAGAGAVQALIAAPLDLIKTQYQKDRPFQQGLSHLVRNIGQTYGYKTFYNNLLIKMIRTSWASAVVIVVLDQCDVLPSNMKMQGHTNEGHKTSNTGIN